MTAQIVPLQVDYILGEDGRDQWGNLTREYPPRAVAERLIRRDIALAVEKLVQIEEIEGAPVPTGKVLRGTVYLAEGWGDIEAAAQARLALARSAEDMARHFAGELDRDRRAFQIEMARARAEFADSFRMAIEEFHGYDECAGRR